MKIMCFEEKKNYFLPTRKATLSDAVIQFSVMSIIISYIKKINNKLVPYVYLQSIIKLLKKNGTFFAFMFSVQGPFPQGTIF